MNCGVPGASPCLIMGFCSMYDTRLGTVPPLSAYLPHVAGSSSLSFNRLAGRARVLLLSRSEAGRAIPSVCYTKQSKGVSTGSIGAFANSLRLCTGTVALGDQEKSGNSG